MGSTPTGGTSMLNVKCYYMIKKLKEWLFGKPEVVYEVKKDVKVKSRRVYKRKKKEVK